MNTTIVNDSYDLLTGDHFHVLLHPDRVHGLIFNRLDRTVTTINYDDAKELANVKYVGHVYGIVGRFLDRHLVLIKGRSKVGCLYEPNSKTDHEVYVITQVQVLDLSNASTESIQTGNSGVPPASSGSGNKPGSSVKYDAASDREDAVDPIQMGELSTFQMKTSDSFSSLPITINTNSYMTNQSRPSNWNPFKLANSLKPMMPTQFLRSSTSSSSSNQASSRVDTQQATERNKGNSESSQSPGLGGPLGGSHVDEADKRLVDEMVKLFNSTNSFYYSPTLDLTNRFSRENLIRRVGNEPVWRAADERFFWNKHMLKDLIELSKEDNDANYFICVILQGFVAIHEQTLRNRHTSLGYEDIGLDENSRIAVNASPDATSNLGDDTNEQCDKKNSDDNNQSDSRENSQGSRWDKFSAKTFRLALVSRRSVFQAGTRYRRRGCDDKGHCANFVETEQIFKTEKHFTSLVMLRCSIPLFWYQSGMNYRPPPVLIKSEEENHEAFTRHFMDLMHQYETNCIIPVDLTEKTGREKALHDAYKRHIDKLREHYPKIKLIEFDYHKYCRGRQCTDAQIEGHLNACGLTDQVLKDVKYYWNDGDVVLKQEGIFRVNCLDCSDRTNVVQRIIALMILDLQLARLGIIAPDVSPEENYCKRVMQTMWSTNGNVLSTQYCGTRALFGGDRKLAGYLKDTYSSASRYYISKFRDVYRQAAIDAMLGVQTVDATELETGQLKDQYELLHFDPILAGQKGGAILRDVGSRVTNRLARLKGRFNTTRPTDTGALGARYQQARPCDVGIVETGLIETLGEMSIDWPSSEDVNNQTPVEKGHEVMESQQQSRNMFEQYAGCDDNFHDDDEFGQLMLSIDLAELQRLRDIEDNQQQEGDRRSCDARDTQAPEQINLTEARAINSQAVGGNGGASTKQQRQRDKLESEGTNTTST